MLIPREHGAYGQLAFPLATALAIGRPTPGAIALAVAGVAAFLGHPSLLVVLGQRGSRAVATTAVHAILGRAARGSGSSSRLVSGVLTLVALVALVILVRVGFVQPVAASAALPVTLVALAGSRSAPNTAACGVVSDRSRGCPFAAARSCVVDGVVDVRQRAALTRMC